MTDQNIQHLLSDCGGFCNTCVAPVKQAPWGTWYITMGHAGYNSPTNNRGGYKTKAFAVAAYDRYRSKGRRLLRKWTPIGGFKGGT